MVGPSWTHGHGAQRPRHRFTAHGGAPHQPARATSCPVSGDAVKPWSAEHTLRFSPSIFPKSTCSPTYVQKHLLLVLYLSILAPVFFNNSTRRPKHDRIQILLV